MSADEQIVKLRAIREAVAITVGILGLVAALAGMAGSWYLLLYRVQSVERGLQDASKRVEDLTSLRQADRELLTRIEERLITVQMEMRKAKP